MFDEDPNFTGSRSQHVPAEVLQARMPFRVIIQAVDNFTDGKLTKTYFDWDVELRGERVCYRNIYKTPPRTRKAAVAQARKAVREYCAFATANVYKR
jgi:hypothetical protein